jgi:hypothetical protein
MVNILKSLICQSGFMINRVDEIYVPIKDKFLCLMSIDYMRNTPKPILCFTIFKQYSPHSLKSKRQNS